MIEKAKVIDALKKGFIDDDDFTVECPYECNGMLEWAIEEVEKMPSDLIRCKDCKHWKHSNIRFNYCDIWQYSNQADDFCSFAERKEEE